LLSLRDIFDAKRLENLEGAHILNTTDKAPEDFLEKVLN